MMKLTPWQMVATLGVLFAAIICAYVFAPGAVTLVVGMATTLFALLVQKHDGDPPAPPTLTLLAGGGTLALLTFLAACGAALTPSDRSELTHVADQIESCQEEGRMCKLLGDGGVNCRDVYENCMKDAGLK
jgi:hypothetical protein